MEPENHPCDLNTNSSELNSLKGTALEAAKRIEDLAAQLMRSAGAQSVSRGLSKNLSEQASRIYEARRKADSLANIEGFSASPVFDSLLDLYINAAKGRSVSVSSACIGAACPPTTALRWLRYLEQQRLVVRGPDPRDQRRIYLSLTEEGIAKIEGAIAHYCR